MFLGYGIKSCLYKVVRQGLYIQANCEWYKYKISYSSYWVYSICFYWYPRPTFICEAGKIKTTFIGLKLFSYFSCYYVLKDHITRYGSFYIVCETNHYARSHFRSYKKCTYFISPVAYYFFRIFVLSNKCTVKNMDNLCYWSGGKKPLVILIVFMHHLII